MRRLRDVLRPKYAAGLPHRAIAHACAVGLGTEKLFVDFSGTRPHLVDVKTGEEIAVELFVGARRERLDLVADLEEP
jgi:hypothetical protein